MTVLVGCGAIRPVSGFVSGDTDAAPHFGTFHTANRWQTLKNKNAKTTIFNYYYFNISWM